MAEPMEDQICITLQMGIYKEHINVDRRLLDMTLIRAKILDFLDKHLSSNKAKNLEIDSVLLFYHNYHSPNLLQLLQRCDSINNGTVIEIVLSSQNTKPDRPHVVKVQSYYAPTFCDYCGEILVGLSKQGLRCTKCNKNFHKKCAFSGGNNCSGYSRSNSHRTSLDMAITDEMDSQEDGHRQYGLPHTFVVHTYKRPTVCRQCNNLLLGVYKQGLQCRECKVNVHRKCVNDLLFDCSAVEPVDSISAELSETMLNGTLDTSQFGLGDPEEPGEQDLIPLGRIPGAIKPHRSSAAPVMEGWMLHFTNLNPTKRRHFWRMRRSSIALFTDEKGQRTYKVIPFADILGLSSYNGPPLDSSGPPHCIEIKTAACIYYVGENLEWYKTSNVPPKLPRRESGLGMSSAIKWLESIKLAMQPPATIAGKYGEKSAQSEGTEKALEFSGLYQVLTDQILGNGQFGTVYGGVHRQSKREVAVKEIMKDRSMSRKWKDALRNEVSILQKLSYPGIIQLEAMFEFADKIYVVMEKLKADMLEMILSNSEGRLTERVTKFLIYQILKALQYLHERDVAHCDLKPENVLLNSDDAEFPQSKLCDFGYARIIGENTFRKTVVGTPAYLAPEVLMKRGYNKSLDMWSVGVVIYVTLSGTFPFNEGEEIEDQIQNAAFMYPQNPWKEMSGDVIDLLNKLLKLEPEGRLSIDECMAHPWLQNDTQLVEDLKTLETQLGVTYLTTELATTS